MACRLLDIPHRLNDFTKICVAYATYTVVSGYNDGTFPYTVQSWIVGGQPRPSRPRRGGTLYTVSANLTARDLRAPIFSQSERGPGL